MTNSKEQWLKQIGVYFSFTYKSDIGNAKLLQSGKQLAVRLDTTQGLIAKSTPSNLQVFRLFLAPWSKILTKVHSSYLLTR